MQTKTIVDVEESLRNALEAMPSIARGNPSNATAQQLAEAAKIWAGYHLVVELHQSGKNGRRKRRSASADNWTPDTGKIVISFDRDTHSETSDTNALNPPRPFASLQTGPSNVPANAAVAFPAMSSASADLRNATLSDPPTPSVDSPDSREQELCRALGEVERQGLAFVGLKRFRDFVLPAKGYSWASDPEQRQFVLAAAIQKGLILTNRIPNPRSPSFPTTTVRLNRSKAANQIEGQRYSPVRIQGEPLSSTILHDRGTD
jgi:hypothetical protein